MPAPVTLCRHRLRARAIAAYGGSSDLYTMLRRLEKAGWPPDVQLMCFNCNCGRSINGGTCPHKDAGRL